MNKIKFGWCSAAGALISYVADDGTWDGTAAGADRLPVVEVGRDLETNEEDMTAEEVVEAFARKGVEAEW